MIQCCTPFYVVALAEILYGMMRGQTVYFTAREGILSAFLLFATSAAGIWLLCKLSTWSKWERIRPLYGKCLAVLLFFHGWIQIFHLSFLSRQEYQTGGVWILLFVIGLLALKIDWHALCRITESIWLVTFLAAFLLAGLLQNMVWKNLSLESVNPSRVKAAYMVLFYFCPELLALPFAQKNTGKIWYKLPTAILIFQGLELIGAEAVFGWEQEAGRFPAIEAVRCCGIGSFSRLDDIFVGLWLFVCMYRLVVVWQLIKIGIAGGQTVEASGK